MEQTCQIQTHTLISIAVVLFHEAYYDEDERKK